jgi:hypothetical protein
LPSCFMTGTSTMFLSPASRRRPSAPTIDMPHDGQAGADYQRRQDEDANLDRRIGLRHYCHRQEAPRAPVHFVQIFSVAFFEKMPMPQALSETRTTVEEMQSAVDH